MTQSVLNYCEELCKIIEKRFYDEYPNPSRNRKFSVKKGRKYYKILENDSSAHAFVILTQEMYLNPLVGTNQQKELDTIY